MTQLSQILSILLLVCIIPTLTAVDGPDSIESRMKSYRERVRRMFFHSYDGYIQYAYPYDELRPLTCDGVDTWGKYSLSLIDALDTLAVMGNYSEFRRVSQLILERASFDQDVNVSVFETNIRVIGGLLSAHLISKRAGMTVDPGWPCSGPLLTMAEKVAKRILPAFDTATGMPYGTVNLRHGVPGKETPITCTAGVATYIVEFGTLSRLTGDPRYEKVALRAIKSLWELRSAIGLVGNHVDVQAGKWTAVDAGIGAGVDSYFEYLVKGSVLLQNPQLMAMFNQYKDVINKYLKRDDWFFWANMEKGSITLPLFQSLEAFWPGVLSMVGDVDQAIKSLHNYHQIWKQYGFLPEFYNVPQSTTQQGREGYPLRPELIESLVYLYRATKDPLLLQMGFDIVESIEHSSKTSCGYATVKNVHTHQLENRMESFFLAETTKYLYLLFEPSHWLHNNGARGELIENTYGECIINTGGYIFNTEAHPIDPAALYCCSAQKKHDDKILEEFHDHLDLWSQLGITDEEDDKLEMRRARESKQKTNEQEALLKLLPEWQDDVYLPQDYLRINLSDVIPPQQKSNDVQQSNTSTTSTTQDATVKSTTEMTAEPPSQQTDESKNFKVRATYTDVLQARAKIQEAIIRGQSILKGARQGNTNPAQSNAGKNESEASTDEDIQHSDRVQSKTVDKSKDRGISRDNIIQTVFQFTTAATKTNEDITDSSEIEVSIEKSSQAEQHGVNPQVLTVPQTLVLHTYQQQQQQEQSPHELELQKRKRQLLRAMNLPQYKDSLAAEAAGSQISYGLLSCPVQPFSSKLSVMGELFDEHR